MILGIGTGIPIGIAGGVFHMINHAMYKCGLFLSAGSVEHRTGTTELKKLGGLYREMPITALCFAVCAAAISGIWPLNGFVSKEMIFHGSKETGFIIFTIAAWLGAIFTFASFLKAGHSTFLGPRTKEIKPVKESEVPILIPMIVLAGLCILFGVYNKLPLTLFIQPILQGHVPVGEHLNFSQHGLAVGNPIAMISILCLFIALAIHFYGWNRGEKRAYLASEPIHNLPVLKALYNKSEARFFDLYEQGIKVLKGLSYVLYVGVDRSIDWIYEKFVTFIGRTFSRALSWAHSGNYANYLAWCIAGLVIIILFIGRLLK
jgi:NADH-quinone oxidoreductase subunit L